MDDNDISCMHGTYTFRGISYVKLSFYASHLTMHLYFKYCNDILVECTITGWMNEIIETIHSFYDSCAPWWSWNTLVDDDMIWPTLWYSQQQYYLTVSRSLPQCTMQNTMNFYKKCFVLSFISCHVFCFWYKQAQNDHVQCKESSYPSFMAVHGIICLWVFKNNGNEWL